MRKQLLSNGQLKLAILKRITLGGISVIMMGTYTPILAEDEVSLASNDCDFIYGVHDDKLNDSQLIKIDPQNGFVIEALGPLYPGYDIEAVDISPDNQLYVAAGDETDKPGYLYKADMVTGQLTEIGPTGLAEIDGISFNPIDGTLWGWAQDAGLIRINPATGAVEIVFATAGEYEDLDWNNTGTILYVIQNQYENYNHPQNYTLNSGTLPYLEPNQDAQVPHVLLAYNVVTNKVSPVCQNEIGALVGNREIEALEVLPDNNLMFGYHHSNNQPILATIDPVDCEITLQPGLTYHIAANQPFSDIEALATCLPLALPQSCPPELTDTDWMYVKDSFNDASGLSVLEIYGMAIKQTGNTITVAINANMGAAGEDNLPRNIVGARKVVDGHVGFSELVFDFGNGNQYAVHFSLGNDSNAPSLGLYTEVVFKDVTRENYGYSTLKSYKRAVGTGSMGDLQFPSLNGYFDINTARSVPMSIAAGVRVADDNYQPLTTDELADLGLNFATGLNVSASQLGTHTFGFSFTKTPEMAGEFTAYFFTECINDGIAMIRELPSC
jgi:hypothetical protein